VLNVWHGQKKNVEEAQALFFEKCKLLSAASLGRLYIEENIINMKNEINNKYNQINKNNISENKINENKINENKIEANKINRNKI